MELKNDLEKVVGMAKQAGKIIMGFYDKEYDIETKNDNTPVTEADLAANDFIMNELLAKFPQDGIVSEEVKGVQGNQNAKRHWYIDPIDGTRGFMNRNGEFAVHIGLAVEGKPVLGVVYRPLAEDGWIAAQGVGALYISRSHTRELVVPSTEEVPLGLVIPDGALRRTAAKELVDRLFAQPKYTGSEGLRMMEVIEGRGNMHINTSTGRCSTWDLCAPQAIVEEAGGLVQYLGGDPVTYQEQRGIDQHFIAARTKDQMQQAQKVMLDIPKYAKTLKLTPQL